MQVVAGNCAEMRYFGWARQQECGKERGSGEGGHEMKMCARNGAAEGHEWRLDWCAVHHGRMRMSPPLCLVLVLK